jgi:hypothetical protein
VDTAVVIIVATIVVASITFLVFGMFRSQEGPKVTEGHRWTAQATLAEMRKEGASLPSEVGAEANRSEGPPGGQPPGTPIQASRPPAGADRGP